MLMRHARFSFLFKKGKNPETTQSLKNVKIENSQTSVDFPYVLGGFPLVSDGRMVRDLCNWTKRKVSCIQPQQQAYKGL